jgi:hypothetical protein
MTLSGLLFFHDISETRMRGTPKQNLSTFEALCGGGALRNVVLTTTMWDKLDERTRVMRENQLRTEFWAPMLSRGCRMERFYSTWESAWAIIDSFSTDSRRPVQIQEEIVDQGKTLSQTSAFAALFQWWWERLKTRFRRWRTLQVPRYDSTGTLTVVGEGNSSQCSGLHPSAGYQGKIETFRPLPL